MAVNTRLLFGSLAVAAVVSVVGGYALNRSGDESEDDPGYSVTMPSAGIYNEPSGTLTNADVRGDLLPAIDLADDDGNVISTADLIGTPLVLNVWSTACVPCQRELPAFAAAHNAYGDVVRFVGINSGRDSVAEAAAFAAKYGVNYEMLKDPVGEFMVELGITSQPYTLFIAADGTIVEQKGLELSEATIRATIDDALLS